MSHSGESPTHVSAYAEKNRFARTRDCDRRGDPEFSAAADVDAEAWAGVEAEAEAEGDAGGSLFSELMVERCQTMSEVPNYDSTKYNMT